MFFYITTPIYYVNAQPHLGHAYTTMAADVLARHMRQRGQDVFFLTGTDEHGEPVADAARAQGLEPQALADHNAERFKALMPQLAVSNDFVMPPRHFREARAFIASGLQDVSLTRARMHWGVPVPWDSRHVFYVWFDALLNYYTALGYARDGEDLTSRFWPATYHVIGKDILKFHTVFWPALLIAAELEVPHHVFVHGFLLGADGRKMSKSLGNVLDPFEVMEEFGTDALRFYLMRDVAFGTDGAGGRDAVKARYEAELANEYGNLAS